MLLSGKTMLDGLTIEDVERFVDENPGFRSPMMGYVAEHWLKKQLQETAGITGVEKIPDREARKGDFLVTLEDGREVSVECKCAFSSKWRKDKIHQDDICTVNLRSSDRQAPDTPGAMGGFSLDRGEFDVLAICVKSLTGNWDYWFIHNKWLEADPANSNKLSTKVNLTLGITPFLFQDFLRSLA